MKNICIELPTWLGDAVMATPAIELIVKYYQDNSKGISLTLLGNKTVLSLFNFHPQVVNKIVINKSYYQLYKLAKTLNKFDIAISFRSSFRGWFLLQNIPANYRHQFKKLADKNNHQVQIYYNFVAQILNIADTNIADKLTLYSKDNIVKNQKKILGINPGAKYGSAKRWHIDGFVAVASKLSNEYEIKIFGSQDELDITTNIAKKLLSIGIVSENLAGKTDINALVDEIKNLSLFITGDSGPMHIAAAFCIPTVAIFGPTRDKQTSQWQNPNSVIVKKDLECQPCMQKICPLKHHKCMLDIVAADVLVATNKVCAK